MSWKTFKSACAASLFWIYFPLPIPTSIILFTLLISTYLKQFFMTLYQPKKCKIYINNDNTAKAQKFKTIETLNDDQLRLRQIIDQIGTLIHRASKVTVKYLDIRF